ncbi:MAG TPA: hypothetical protein VGO57_18570 [Verrucomicrobiae bacterium]|jgi:hypothetical protein
MSETAATPPPILPEAAPLPEKVLRRLFLTLFLRGRSARQLKRATAPNSIGKKLALTLVFYALVGATALSFWHQPVFALAAYVHAMTFVFLGMFVASSAGEVLFNKEEADILLHRPIRPQTMLWAKIRVLVEVSLWLAFAFNLAGLYVGFNSAGGWRFPIIHIFSTTLEALFCTGSIVLAYQLCLRWFGRERLDGLMTMAQVFIAIAAVLSGQILPRLLVHMNHVLGINEASWWIALLPPAWFAGVDDAFAGSSQMVSWLLAAIAVTTTSLVLWLAFGKLAHSYEIGLQTLNETVAARGQKSGRRRWLDQIVSLPPLSWWLRDPVSRASFLLTIAYLLRDRDVKLRVYPGIAPMLILPFVFLLQDHGHQATATAAPNFFVPFTGAYLGLVPLLGLRLLQYSQQWQAADVFRVAPLAGPAALCHGARRAVLCLLVLPILLLVGLIVWLLKHDLNTLFLLLPGIIALPIFALVPNLRGRGVPLSVPTDSAKSAGRGLMMIPVMFIAFGIAGLASFSWTHEWFWQFIAAEVLVVIIAYAILRWMIDRARWPAMG